MQHQYDPQADALYVRLRPGDYARGVDIDERRRVDYDAEGVPIGVEFLGVSEGLDFDGLPESEGIRAYMSVQMPSLSFPASVSFAAYHTEVGVTIVRHATPTVSVSTWSETGAAAAR